jgi:hypothetical protein
VLVSFLRTVKTASGATAVQIVWSWRRGSRSIEHIGSAHDEVELAALRNGAAARLAAAGQAELDHTPRSRQASSESNSRVTLWW